MNEELTAVAKRIGALHEQPVDDHMAMVKATEEARRDHGLDSQNETKKPMTERTSEKSRRKHSLGSKAVAIVGTVLAVFGAEKATEEVLDVLRHDNVIVEDYKVSLDSGDTVTNMVSNALDDIAESNHINRGELSGTSEAQAAASEMKAATGEEYNQPGEMYNIDIFENDLGDKEVSVEPVIETVS